MDHNKKIAKLNLRHRREISGDEDHYRVGEQSGFKHYESHADLLQWERPLHLQGNRPMSL